MTEDEGPHRSALSARVRRSLLNELSHALRQVPHLVALLPEVLRAVEEDTGHRLALDEGREPAQVAFQLVQNCARLPEGLRSLALTVDGFANGTESMDMFSRLIDEWNALSVVSDLEPIWVALKTELSAVPDGRMTALYLRAVGHRPVDLPRHCTTVWSAFVRLLDRPANPGGIPPWLTLLVTVRPTMSSTGAAMIFETLDQITAGWQAEDLMSQAEEAASSSQGHAAEADATGGIVVIRIEPSDSEDDLHDDTFHVSHVLLIGDHKAPADKSSEQLVHRKALESAVEQLIKATEATWNSRLDDIDLEFMLPVSLINEPVEWWGKDLSIAREDRPQLAQYYDVIMRSVDRFTDPVLHRLWRKKWKQLLDHPDKCHVIWAESGRPGHLRMLESELLDDSCIGVVLSRPPEPRRGVNQEFAVALRAGLPLIIWHRFDCDRPDFHQIVSVIIDHPLERVPIRASTLRQRMGRLTGPQRENQAVMGLAVLFDDASRLPVADATATG